MESQGALVDKKKLQFALYLNKVLHWVREAELRNEPGLHSYTAVLPGRTIQIKSSWQVRELLTKVLRNG